MDLAQGELLGGRYALGEVLGRGGMGEVRAAEDRRLGRSVAVKLLRPELADQAPVRRRFEGEGRAAARLSHPNVATVYDVGEHAGTPFLVMERVDGPGLNQELAAGPLSADRARRIFSEVLAALGAAHSAGLVHRDVKPANVLLAANDTVKVVDFGIAKALDENGQGDGGVTSTGQIVGTVAYMAPELVTGEPATVQSDLYSVGVMLYEALSGARPYPGESPVQIARTIVHTRPDPLAGAHPEVDPGLAGVVERAMARRPEDRFSTAADMAAALSAPPPAPGRCRPDRGGGPSPTELFTAPVAPAPPASVRSPDGGDGGPARPPADRRTPGRRTRRPAPPAARHRGRRRIRRRWPAVADRRRRHAHRSEPRPGSRDAGPEPRWHPWPSRRRPRPPHRGRAVKRPVLAAAMLIAAGSLLAGCGEEDHRLPDEASALLAPRVEAIRSAAAAGDRATAQAEVSQVRRTLADLRAAGTIAASEADTVLLALAGVEQQLGLLPEPTTTTTTITTTTTAPPAGDDDKDEPKKKAKGRRRGRLSPGCPDGGGRTASGVPPLQTSVTQERREPSRTARSCAGH